ncbi:MAG: hypothetical protein LBI87_04410 [Candidatus Accumulibacter sp.]|nr:hypothetical protein [Accumulibacter sp.]
MRILLTAVVLAAPTSGCDFVQQELGIDTPAAKAARDEADGQAVGGACRQSGRAIEDCYAIYSWLPRASIYGGWRDMDAYMRENNLETIAPQLPPVQPPPPPPPRKKAKKPAADGADAEKPAKSS